VDSLAFWVHVLGAGVNEVRATALKTMFVCLVRFSGDKVTGLVSARPQGTPCVLRSLRWSHRTVGCTSSGPVPRKLGRLLKKLCLFVCLFVWFRFLGDKVIGLVGAGPQRTACVRYLCIMFWRFSYLATNSYTF
jgi:hypothetical protein